MSKLFAKFLFYLLGIAGLVAAGYGIYCGVQMGHYIGTRHYWSNPWFYKAHALLCAVIVLDSAMSVVGRKLR